jgi:hypothetical protein
MPDQMSDTFVTVDAAGNIGADFTGHIHATGLDLDAALGNVQNLNEIRWLRTSDGAVVASISGNILGTQGGAGADYSGFINVLADAVGALTSAEVVLTAISNFDPTTGTQLLLASAPGNAFGNRHQAIVQCDDDGGIGVHQAVVLDGSGRSNFQQVFDGTQAAPLITRRSARDFGRLTSAQFTTLLANITPTDGDTFTLIADAAQGIDWRFVYVAGSASAFKWEFIGGAPIVRQDDGTVQTNSAAYAIPAAGTGAQISAAVARAGDYEVSHYATYNMASATLASFGITFNAAATSLNLWQTSLSSATNINLPGAGTKAMVGVTAGATIQPVMASSAGFVTALDRQLVIRPIRVS